MSGHANLATLRREMVGGKHRAARVLRFVHRHPDAHRKLIGQLRRLELRRQRRARARFELMQRTQA